MKNDADYEIISYIDTFLTVRGLSDNTKKSYKEDLFLLKTFISSLNIDIYSLDKYHAELFIKHLMDEKEYETVNNSNDMMKWILSRENIDKNKKNILLAHQFVMWDGKLPEQCDSESISLNNVGTLDAIDVNLLDDFDYMSKEICKMKEERKNDSSLYSLLNCGYIFKLANEAPKRDRKDSDKDVKNN